MLVVNHNLTAQNANRQLNIVTGLKCKSTEKLSSGYRINRAADDAAGLSISEKMRWQIRGLNRASQNIQDGISLVQVADGALGEIHSMLHRMKELAVQASNDTNTDSDRKQLQNEVAELKKEISRTFNTTEFNTMPIFRCPYTIGVAEDPNDIQLFNVNDSGDQLAGSGGLIFNSRRYTWGELGASVSNGVFTSDFTYKETDPSGELIELSASAGDSVANIIRYYQITSDEKGISVNNVPAARWQGTSASGKWAGVDVVDVEDGMYTFNFHGMDISFAPDEEDDMETIISRLNPDTLSSERTMYFMAQAAGTARENAVHSSNSITSMVLDVTESNKADIENFTYEISADDTGVTIHQTNGNDGITHKKIAWSEFKNVNSGAEFKFTDWGLTDEGSNPVTYDASATYRYTDQTTTDMESALDFTFTVRDEASKAGIIDGLNGIVLTSGSVYAPLNQGGTTDKTGVVLDFHTGIDDFEFERDVLKRTFDDAVSPIEGTVTRTRVYDGTVDTYVQTHTMQELYVKKITEVRNASDELISTTEEYVALTSQGYTDEHEETDPTTGETTKWYFEKNASDNGFSYYYNNGTNVVSADSYVSNGIYAKDNSGTVIGNDDDHTAYDSSAIGTSGQKYIYTDTGWSLDKTYRTFTNSYTYTNSAGGNVLSGSGTQHIDSKSGVVDWKGNAVDTSDAKYSAANITITDSSGRNWVKSTAFANEGAYLKYNNDANRSIYLWYQNGQDSSDGSGTNFATVHTSIQPTDEATKTFIKADVSKGNSLRTDYGSKTAPPPEKLIHIQSGALGFQSIDLVWDGMSLSTIGLGSANVSTAERAQRTISLVDDATDIVSTARSRFGAYQNRLEYAMHIDDYTSENTQDAESRIRDTDMAKETVNNAKHSVLEQVGMSVLSQANQNSKGVLMLLQ